MFYQQKEEHGREFGYTSGFIVIILSVDVTTASHMQHNASGEQ
jgi:hypothetical protein